MWTDRELLLYLLGVFDVLTAENKMIDEESQKRVMRILHRHIYGRENNNA